MGPNQTYKLLHSKGNYKQNEKTTHRMAIIKQNPQIINAGKGVQKREPSYIVAGSINWCTHCGKQYSGSSKN